MVDTCPAKASAISWGALRAVPVAAMPISLPELNVLGTRDGCSPFSPSMGPQNRGGTGWERSV